MNLAHNNNNFPAGMGAVRPSVRSFFLSPFLLLQLVAFALRRKKRVGQIGMQ
jgi:hypothetical protein